MVRSDKRCIVITHSSASMSQWLGDSSMEDRALPNVTVVDPAWVSACAESGQLLPLDKYIIASAQCDVGATVLTAFSRAQSIAPSSGIPPTTVGLASLRGYRKGGSAVGFISLFFPESCAHQDAEETMTMLESAMDASETSEDYIEARAHVSGADDSVVSNPSSQHSSTAPSGYTSASRTLPTGPLSVAQLQQLDFIDRRT